MLPDLESLARFSTIEEHERFEKGIIRERALRDEIRKLQQYRAMGLRAFDEIESYNRQAAKRHEMLNSGKRIKQDEPAAPAAEAAAKVLCRKDI